ncbi:hypothetical protein OEZ85_007918 [Tetradesmus obliquus]|uniref:Short-chain dehydrogenase/reductase SDR n=1 Tax=Tetradesmus obliquus TaxID=3088 RepID=A0ABY8THE4_TETOB|nr:hypothetical protein OEZ85_007918 [Tetradesmus obliquus]
MGSLGSSEQGLAVVVGANKGIGLGLCQVLLAEGYGVLATCRSTSAELDATAAKVVQGVDVTSAAGLEPLFPALQSGSKVQLLVVCAGYQKLDSLASLDTDDLDKHWQINAVGPLRVVQSLMPLLEDGKSKVVILSSKMGSQGAQDIPAGGGLYGYRMSKTALNMAGKLLAEDLAGRGIPVGIVHPGPVHTDMLRSLRISRGVTDESKLAAGTISVKQSSASICSYIATKLDMSTSGQFWAADTDKVLPW